MKAALKTMLFNAGGSGDAEPWKRYIAVKVNNAELDQAGQISKMLVQTMGFKNKADQQDLIHKENFEAVIPNSDMSQTRSHSHSPRSTL
jgi:hypothetical protein